MAEYTTLLYDERGWMLFVDGENLTKRGQDILKSEGARPTAGPHWRRDVYLWTPRDEAHYAFFVRQGFPLSMKGGGPVVAMATRAYYYTSTTSDEPEWTETRLALRALGFEPRLFKRTGGRSKAVDVALTTEVLTLGSERRYEVAVIFAGDGDYAPLIEAVKRMGLHVVVGFFEENGLSPELRIAADQFVNLTPHFVRAWKTDAESRERAAAIAKATADQEAGGVDVPGPANDA